MTLPGFTADASLYKTSAHYNNRGRSSNRGPYSNGGYDLTAGAQGPGQGMIHPAQMDRSGRINYNPSLKILCQPGTVCVSDPNNPACQTCTYYDENCKAGLGWYDCGPKQLHCAPLTTCNSDPHNPFCDICTDIDENCHETSHQVCVGVEIPNKIPINLPDPALRLTI